MIKFLFFDHRDVETVEGFVRRVEFPMKNPGNPLMVSDLPSEVNLMSLYGTVVRRPDGLWQLWYKCYNPNGRGPALGYGESDDGVRWRRPALDIVKFNGENTNIVFDLGPHGTAVLYDEMERRPGWRYKMVHGAKPTERLSAHRSPDGMHWVPAGENPILGITSGGPVGLLRADDGRYVLYIRPNKDDRRVARSESWDFINWTEPKVVVDQEPLDQPQVQFYGMGATVYGGYEIGTPWIYRTNASDMGFYKKQGAMLPELAYSRGGYAWHRCAPGQTWLNLGNAGSWEAGQLHAASSLVFLDNEIRFYYTGCRVPHEVVTRDKTEPLWGLGYASLKPDRFVALDARPGPGRMLTRPFWTETPKFYANANVRPGGELRFELTDCDGAPIEGLRFDECRPISGDSTRHQIRWSGKGAAIVANRQIRLRVSAKDASLYSIFSGTDEELSTYWKFRIPHYREMAAEKLQA